MALFRRRERAVDKVKRAGRRMGEFCDRVLGEEDRGADGKRALQEVRRVLTRDIPRYFRRLPIPHRLSEFRELTLTDVMHLLPLVIVVAVMLRYSTWLSMCVVFLVFLANA